MRSNAVFSICCSLLSLSALSALAECHADDATLRDVLVRQHRTADGTGYFAMAIRPTMKSSHIKRHVVLVDTSASQVGTVRESSLRGVQELLKALPATNTVRLCAVDVECLPLTDEFVAVHGKEAQQALEQLNLRTPLGTTDLDAALSEIIAMCDTEHPTSVLYIGDGFSSNRISERRLREIVKQLSKRRVSVHSAVLGPKTTTELPGILANLTGGTVRRIARGNEAEQARQLAGSLELAPKTASSFMADGHPVETVGSQHAFLRTDRHTVLLGRGDVADFQRLTCTTSDGERLTWLAAQRESSTGGAELVQLVDLADSSKGLNVTVADVRLLDEASDDFRQAVSSSIRQAKFLARNGHAHQARVMLNAVADLDDTNTEVKTILTGLLSQPADEDNTNLSAPPPGNNGALDGLDEGTGQGTSPLADVAANVRLQSQILTAETNAIIDQANARSAEDPEYATSLLKGILETIEASADISPDVRIELKRRVIAAIGDVKSRREIDALRRKQVARDQAVKEAQERLLRDESIAEKRLGIQIEKIRGLLERGRRGDREAFEDAEYESRITLDQKPGSGPATQALVMSEALGQLDKAYNLVNLRHDRFLEVLYQVELSHVPFPDEPPIQYPPADVWRALTLTRKPRYESTDLRTEAPVEKWLRQMLDKPVRNLDFPGDTPLSEILDTIESYFTATYGAGVGAGGTDFKMTIYPDQGELSLEQVTSLEDVTITDIAFDGMSLRNALKLIFDQTEDDTKSPVPLTYVIQNEVMMITTKDKAESADNLVTRVYPVADLVISPSAAQQLGGGGGLGGGGLGGGGQFGGGGGQFGGGGGQFGGGQGFMSIPPVPVQPQGGININGANPIKKK